ncbi:hypothetical protein LQZ18_02310 [Lachnospiraceae bacterium ZAX-1]
MNIDNNVSNTSYAYATPKSTQNSSSEKATGNGKAAANSKAPDYGQGVVYEQSKDAQAVAKSTTYSIDRNDVIAQLKSASEQRVAQLQSMVKQLMGQQGAAIGNSDSIWQFLSKGNFTVTAEAKAQAQAAIAEDGYWGVNQTSDRIIEFAKALTGSDPSKAEAMRSAFEKGFKEATKSWGKELPSISKNTYDATIKKFDDWISQGTKATTEI